FYSPHELAGVWQADPTVLQLTKFAGLTTELATRLPNRRVAYYSPDDKYLLVEENDSDRVLNVGTGNPLVLNRNPLALNVIDAGMYTQTLWLGDGSRLLFREGNTGTRLLTVHPESGVTQHLADYESGMTFVQLPGSPQLVVIDSSTTGQPPGIYQLNP
ncbi:MAG: hypothetical protein ACYC8T_15035, partial [Myxococcaceae bacterium]